MGSLKVDRWDLGFGWVDTRPFYVTHDDGGQHLQVILRNFEIAHLNFGIFGDRAVTPSTHFFITKRVFGPLGEKNFACGAVACGALRAPGEGRKSMCRQRKYGYLTAGTTVTMECASAPPR